MIHPGEIRGIDAECRHAVGTETGGLLIQRPGVLYATDPGPRAVLTRDSMQWDAEYIARWLDVLLPGELVGRWHKHCGPILLASEADRQSAEAFRRIVRTETILDLIVATEDDAPIAYAAYLCSADGYQRLAIPEAVSA